MVTRRIRIICILQVFNNSFGEFGVHDKLVLMEPGEGLQVFVNSVGGGGPEYFLVFHEPAESGFVAAHGVGKGGDGEVLVVDQPAEGSFFSGTDVFHTFDEFAQIFFYHDVEDPGAVRQHQFGHQADCFPVIDLCSHG